MRSRDFLTHYAGSFATAEINASFYRLPTTATLESWRTATPAGFVFAAKASRYITHMKKLAEPTAGTTRFLTRMRALGRKLGPILFQLPPHWACNEARLTAFLDGLDRRFRYAFEFRDPSWLNDRTFALLAAHDAALCIYELAGFSSPLEITSDLVYVRLHGPTHAYGGSYDRRALRRWAERLTRWAAEGHNVYCYFDNDEAGYAARNALELQAMLPTATYNRAEALTGSRHANDAL
jgi:uncharacterized protein YecE (DUF72 family)